VTRVLHVLGRLDHGGVESWLVGLAGGVDRGRVQLDFVVHDRRPGALEAAVVARGCRVHVCPLGPGYPSRLRRILRTHGPYDVVHSHVHHFSALVLAVARLAGVPIRVAHSHSDTRAGDARAPLPRRAYLALASLLLRATSTARVAASGAAAAALFGARWRTDPAVRVVHCGIDLARYGRSGDGVRRELGIPAEALLLGHVGRLAPPKNHPFLLEVMAEVARREPRAHLLLVGGGPLEARLRSLAAARDLSGRVHFAGPRDDVPRLLAAMDLFVFPSLWEGMPLGLVEAQASGLPCLVSDSITPEATVVPELVVRLPLSQGPARWAEVALRLRAPATIGPAAALARVRRSDFELGAGIRALEALYGAA
jgi:glycosyltransferase involved in cell wall biosynthesis